MLPHPYSENSCDSFFRPVDLHGNRPPHAASAKRPEVGLGIPKPTSGHRKRRATRGRIKLGILTPSGGRFGRSRNRPKKVLRKSPGTGRSGGARTAGSGRLQILIDFLFQSGRLEPFRHPAGPVPFRAVFGPPRNRTSRRPERRTGTRVQRDDPSLKVNDDEHDDEHHEDDDDDDANKFKVSSKDPRCPDVKFRIPKPTSGHQELHHEASSQDIAPSQIIKTELENKIPKPTSGHQELVRNSRSRSERTESR